jgi:D-sedoheptulose 7-phosphate isomerase
MDKSNFFYDFYKEIDLKVKTVNYDLLLKASRLIENTKQASGKIIIIGNGGSAAIASHVSIDLTKAANIRSINFNESSLLTCFSNDYGYELWAEKAIEFFSDKGDLVILISSSGQSANIINAAKKAKETGLNLITLSGFSKSNPLNSLGDLNFWVDSSHYNTVETVHQTWLLSIVDFLIANNINRKL